MRRFVTGDGFVTEMFCRGEVMYGDVLYVRPKIGSAVKTSRVSWRIRIHIRKGFIPSSIRGPDGVV
jgi:hypothetical protein